METVLVVFTALLPVLLVIASGWLARAAGWLTPAADAPLLRVVVNLFYPALILHYTLGNEALAHPANLLFPPLVGFTTVLLGFGLAWWMAPWWGLRQKSLRRTFAFTTGLYNYGYIPIPLVELYFRDRSLAGVLLVHNIGVEMAFWTVGILLLSGSWNRESWKKIFNPPVLALFLAVVCNLAGFGYHLPMAFRNGLAMLAACAIPVGLLLTGATLQEMTRDAAWLKGWQEPVAAVLLRLGLLPICFLLLAKWMPFSPELQQIIVVQAAMPAAMLPVVITRHYQGDTLCAVKVVVSTTICSILTIPLWISFGLFFLSV